MFWNESSASFKLNLCVNVFGLVKIPIFINSIIFRSDAVRVGDRILAINEITLRGKPLWKAFELLRIAGDTVKLLIKRDKISLSSKQSMGRKLFTPHTLSRFFMK